MLPMTPTRLISCGPLVAALHTASARAAESKGVAMQAFELRMAGQAPRAKELVLAALKKAPNDASAHFELGRTALYLFELDRAQRAIDQAVTLRPKDARYHYFAGLMAQYNAVWKYKDPKTRRDFPRLVNKALAAFSKAVALKPGFHEARFCLVNCYLKNPPDCGGDREKALEHTKALEAASATHGAKARALMLGRRAVKERRALWEKIVAKHPNSAAAHEGMARVYFGTKKGLTHLNKTLTLDPGRGELLLDLCRHYAMANQFDKAEQAIGRYLAFKPSPAKPMLAYATGVAAMLQKMQGKDKRAEELLAKAKKLDPKCWITFMQPDRALFTAP